MRSREILTRTSNIGTVTAGTIRGCLLEAIDSSGNVRVKIDGSVSAPSIWLRADNFNPGHIEFGDVSDIHASLSGLIVNSVNGSRECQYSQSVGASWGRASIVSFGGVSAYETAFDVTSEDDYGSVSVKLGGTDVIEALKDSGGPKLGFFNATPVVQQLLSANPTNAEISTALRNLGLTHT